MSPQGITAAAVAPARSGTGPASGNDLDPWRPSPSDPWDRRKAAHLLRRAGFGYKPEELDAVVQLGMDRTVDLLLTPQRIGLQERGYTVLPQGELLNLSTDVYAQRAHWIHEAVHTTSPLREKLAAFWHDHFSVGLGTSVNIEQQLLIRHVNIFRQIGLGKFKDILIEVTRDPAMLRFLDNWINGRVRNSVPVINENYGRELLELYTMGEGNGYTQNDVIEASKCLSGWSLYGGWDKFRYYSPWHVPGAKTVLGKTIAASGMREVYDLVDVILGHPSTALYTGRKIWEYFVAEDPAPPLMAQVADVWRKSDYDVLALLSTILRSNYFYSDQAMRRLVKSPLDFVVGSIRNLGSPTIRSYRTLGIEIERMGLPLLRYGTPAGLEEGVAWIDSISMIARANYAYQLTQVNPNAGYRVLLDPWREIARANLKTAEDIVDHYLDVLVDGAAPPLVRTFLLEFMNRNDRGLDPFQLTNAKVQEKVTGLLHLVLSLPEYQIL